MQPREGRRDVRRTASAPASRPDRHGEGSSRGVRLKAFTTAPARAPRRERLPVFVLAGGRSRRFDGDKLSAMVDHEPVLARVVARVRPLASRVVVATDSEERREQLSSLFDRSVDYRLDRVGRWGAGPGATIASALAATRRGSALFVPGDIPWVETDALARFVARARASSADVAAPYWGSGETEHLIQWHRSRQSLRPLPWGRPGGTPTRRASELLRAAPRTLLVPITALTERPESFAHVTYRSDVRRPGPRGTSGSTGRRARTIAGVPKAAYREAQRHRSAGREADAARLFRQESGWYAAAGLRILARHALDDASGPTGKR
ncbi:MAG: nucleotidyltransferase family protein [Thermoplasmata archaeon]